VALVHTNLGGIVVCFQRANFDQSDETNFVLVHWAHTNARDKNAVETPKRPARPYQECSGDG